MAQAEDFPLATIAASMDAAVKAGGFVLQKWTCEGCGQRITASNLNVVVENDHCQHCKHVTDLKRRGCNFALIQTTRPDLTVADMERLLGLVEPGLH